MGDFQSLLRFILNSWVLSSCFYWNVVSGIGGQLNKLDLSPDLEEECRSIPSQALVDATTYYEEAGLVGLWYNHWYWEVKFIHENRKPIVTRQPVTSQVFWNSSCPYPEGNNSPPKNPNNCFWPGVAGRLPYVTAAHYLDGEVFILIPRHGEIVTSEANIPERNIFVYRYSAIYDIYSTTDPKRAMMPVYSRTISPEMVMPQFASPKFFVSPGLTATFVTLDPDHPTERILWTNELRADLSLKGWTHDRITPGSDARVTFDLVGADGRTKNPNLIWAMDTYARDTSNASRSADLILNFRRLKGLLQDQGVSYVLSFCLSNGFDGKWRFERMKDVVWDAGMLLGCPQAFCFDTTMDGAVGTKSNKVATSGSKPYTTYVLRGRYIFNINHERPFILTYPFTNLQKVPPPSSGLKTANVKSIRDVIVNGDYLAENKEPTVEALLVVISDDKTFQSIYLIRKGKWFLYSQADEELFYEHYHLSGSVGDLFSGFPTNMPLDATWYNKAEKRVYIFVGTMTWTCGLSSSGQRGTPHRFDKCESQSLGERKPMGWRSSIDATLSYPDEDMTLFTRGSLGWLVPNSMPTWKEAKYSPRLMHDLKAEGASGVAADEQQRGLFVDPYNHCDYSDYEHTTKEEVWQFMLNFLTAETQVFIEAEKQARPESDTYLVVRIYAGVSAAVTLVLLLIAAGFMGYTWLKRKSDADEMFSMLSARASMRSQISSQHH